MVRVFGLRAEGTRTARSTRGVVQCLDNGKTAESNSAVPEMQSSLGMRMDNSLLETSAAACVRLRCPEPQVLHALFDFLPTKTQVLRYRVPN